MTEIFVFGSNLAGRHGAGSALEARKNWGAKYGCGIGPQGNSYAIPTKDASLKTLPLDEIATHIKDFIWYTKNLRPLDTFKVVDIGCGLAGYHPKQIAPLFDGIGDNIHFLGKLRYFYTQYQLRNSLKLNTTGEE